MQKAAGVLAVRILLALFIATVTTTVMYVASKLGYPPGDIVGGYALKVASPEFIALALLVLVTGSVWFAADYFLYRRPTPRQRKEQLLAEIARLRTKLVRFRVEMVKQEALKKSEKEWDREFGEIAKEIREKIVAFAGEPEAEIYDARGTIKRHFGEGTLPHQRVLDIVVHDLEHLREFIKDYSRNKHRNVG